MSGGLLLLVGTVLLAMALCERWVRRLPLSPSLVYLCVGWAAASVARHVTGGSGFGPSGAPPFELTDHAHWLLPFSEAAVLLSLFAIGLRLGRPAPTGAWRLAVVLASVGLLVTIALVSVAAWALLALPWAAALLLAAMLSPTDPVLASDVQLRSVQDQDAVRLTLTVEGALNDGTAFPVVLLALALLGLHDVGAWGERWMLIDLAWPVGAGAALGWACGRALDAALRALRFRAHALDWDELLYLGAIAVVYCLATLAHVSTFLAVFACGCAMFAPALATRSAQRAVQVDHSDVRERMMAFGSRLERLVEVLMVLLLGAALSSTRLTWPVAGFVAATLLVARPLTVLLVSRERARGASKLGRVAPPPHAVTRQQRRLIAWFGIRGVGSLFYLCYAVQSGLTEPIAQPVIDACLLCIAGSIVLHGISATPLMEWRRRWPIFRN